MLSNNIPKPQSNQILIKDGPIPVATLDANLNFLSYSDLWCIEHQIDDPNIVDKHFFDVLPNLPLSFKKILDNCLKGNPCKNDGTKFTAKNGKHIWLKWRINPSFKNNNVVVGLVVILEDITETKKIDNLTSEAQEVSRTGGWEVNLLTNKVLWTKMVNLIHEVPLDFVPKTYDECFMHFKEGENRNGMYLAAEKAVNEGVSWDKEVLMITGKGNEIWIRTKGQAEFVDGKCVRIFGICQDINAYKQQELKHKEEAKLLKSVITVSNVGTWEYNLNTRVLIWDDLCYELNGVDKKKLKTRLFKAWKNVLHPEDIEHIRNNLSLYTKGLKNTGTVEYRIILPNKKIRNLKTTLTFLTDPKSSDYKAIGITQDITQEKLAEEKLKEFADITIEQNNSLTNFAHMISHDLRTHSTNLSVLTSLLIDEKNETKKDQILAMLKKATDSLNSTVYNLNEVVQSNDTDIKNKLIPVNLLSTITTVQNNIGIQFKEKKAICSINIPSKQMVTVVPAYLDSIILNLFTNSLKYCSPERPPIITISSKIYDNILEVTFADNGKGIDMDKFGKNIFGMRKTFHRNKDARGVGLFITKNQIEAMGGSISVTSNVNTGTTFVIKFKS